MLHKFVQSQLEGRFAAGLYRADGCYVNGFAHGLKNKTEGGRNIIDIPATRGVNIIAGKKVNIGCEKSDVPLNVPFKVQIRRRPDKGRRRVDGGHLDESRHSIDSVVS